MHILLVTLLDNDLLNNDYEVFFVFFCFIFTTVVLCNLKYIRINIKILKVMNSY
jgi:hypothetical protein